jgi:multiple antibiotic resistance protein
MKKHKFRVAFDKNMEILLRLNGFFIGAIGINMIIQGINSLYY